MSYQDMKNNRGWNCLAVEEIKSCLCFITFPITNSTKYDICLHFQEFLPYSCEKSIKINTTMLLFVYPNIPFVSPMASESKITNGRIPSQTTRVFTISKITGFVYRIQKQTQKKEKKNMPPIKCRIQPPSRVAYYKYNHEKQMQMGTQHMWFSYFSGSGSMKTHLTCW